MEKIIAKAEKIMALAMDAKNGGSAHEYEAAMLKLQMLLAENNITLSEIGQSKKEEKFKREFCVRERRVTYWKNLLANIIATHFQCSAAKVRGVGIMIFGRERDIVLAKMALELAMKSAMNEWRKEEKTLGKLYRKDKELIKNTFLVSFVKGVEAAFKKQEAENTKTLVVIKPDAVIKFEAGLKTSRSKSSYAGSLSQASKGYQAGENHVYGNRVSA